MMGQQGDVNSEVVEVRFAPTACCAVKNTGIKFYEEYKGSGYEDTDYIMQLKEKTAGAKVVISNRCRVTHKNEMKSQAINYPHNRAVFVKRWGNVDI